MYVCGATSKTFNSIENMITWKVKKDVLRFGYLFFIDGFAFFE